MIIAFTGGVVFGPGATGVTRLMETGMLSVVVPLVLTPPFTPSVFVVTINVPVLAPGAREVGLAVTVTTRPCAGSSPELGVTVRYGWSVVAVNVVTAAVCVPGMSTCSPTGVVLPNGTAISALSEEGGAAAWTTVCVTCDVPGVPPVQCVGRTR